MAPYGLFYLLQTHHTPVPLLEVRAKAIIKDLAASVQLSQVFTNESADTIECTYFFPIPARAAVYSFHLVKEDGTKVVGIVQEKEEARETYNQAVSEGKLASLMEQETPDSKSTLANLGDDCADIRLTTSLHRVCRQRLATRKSNSGTHLRHRADRG